MTNLILGTAVHCQVHQLKPFVESWKKHAHGAQLALVIAPDESSEVIQYLKSSGVRLIYFVSFFFILTRIHNTRFMRYLEFLLENHFDHILMTDVTDVVFQGDPFTGALPRGLHVFQEDAKYFCGLEPHNAMWIKNNYGEEVRQQMETKPIFCSGTIMGDHASVIHFLTMLLQERSPQRFIELGGKEDDQGPFNYLIHTEKLSCHRHANGDIVGTVILMDDQDLQVQGHDVLTYGKKPHVLHQYVKKPKLLEHFQKMYCGEALA